MTSREKTIVAILGSVILVTLVGIGVLTAKLITDASNKPPEGISVTEASLAEAAPELTVTLVSAPSVQGLIKTTPAPVESKPVVVIRQESAGPLAPVLIADQPLNAGHRYRVEITTASGAKIPIHGSWGQSATSASGQVAAPQIEFFDGTTPYSVNIKAPVSDPSIWGLSVSAGPKGGTLKSPSLVITVWDVTGSQ